MQPSFVNTGQDRQQAMRTHLTLTPPLFLRQDRDVPGKRAPMARGHKSMLVPRFRFRRARCGLQWVAESAFEHGDVQRNSWLSTEAFRS